MQSSKVHHASGLHLRGLPSSKNLRHHAVVHTSPRIASMGKTLLEVVVLLSSKETLYL